jgi:hypothetical protein
MSLLDEVELHLDSEDASLRDGRRERTIFLMRLGYPEQGMVLMNGDSVIRPWMELRTAYIHPSIPISWRSTFSSSRRRRGQRRPSTALLIVLSGQSKNQ